MGYEGISPQQKKALEGMDPKTVVVPLPDGDLLLVDHRLYCASVPLTALLAPRILSTSGDLRGVNEHYGYYHEPFAPVSPIPDPEPEPDEEEDEEAEEGRTEDGWDGTTGDYKTYSPADDSYADAVSVESESRDYQVGDIVTLDRGGGVGIVIAAKPPRYRVFWFLGGFAWYDAYQLSLARRYRALPDHDPLAEQEE